MQQEVFKTTEGMKKEARGPPALLYYYEYGALLSADQFAT
jgi:hypothetical protein